jgi:hypothetical protein
MHAKWEELIGGLGEAMISEEGCCGLWRKEGNTQQDQCTCS